ncbi:MAG: Gfo/Idh/MocA family oxidoreductase [Verrucomicrobiales bacterium]|nr:Gfo/Idh/MocA family oxidoreductase [Verrucomicrobiales bacterium]
MNGKKCRWGILGTAGIARKNWQAIRNSGSGQLVAVASRTEERAAQYIAENQAQVPHDPPPRPIAGYDEMIAADDIDAIYLPLPTGLRKEFVIKAAAAGKHVLCEKPCGINADEVREIVEACSAHGVQFMDGVMFMHSARLPALREVLDEGAAVGEIKRIASQFSFMAPPDFFDGNIRMHSGLEPLGSLGDLGWYCVRMTLWTLNYEMPVSLKARMIRDSARPDSPDPVPITLSAEMVFASGVTASFYCSFEAEHQQWINISGTKGHIAINDFVLPYHGSEVGFDIEQAHFETDLCQFHMERHSRRISVNEYSDSHATSQETMLFRNFSDLVLNGKVDSHWPEISLQTQEVLDACLKSAKNGGEEVLF